MVTPPNKKVHAQPPEYKRVVITSSPRFSCAQSPNSTIMSSPSGQPGHSGHLPGSSLIAKVTTASAASIKATTLTTTTLLSSATSSPSSSYSQNRQSSTPTPKSLIGASSPINSTSAPSMSSSAAKLTTNHLQSSLQPHYQHVKLGATPSPAAGGAAKTGRIALKLAQSLNKLRTTSSNLDDMDDRELEMFLKKNRTYQNDEDDEDDDDDEHDVDSYDDYLKNKSQVSSSSFSINKPNGASKTIIKSESLQSKLSKNLNGSSTSTSSSTHANSTLNGSSSQSQPNSASAKANEIWLEYGCI
jgi:hypothetical protein